MELETERQGEISKKATKGVNILTHQINFTRSFSCFDAEQRDAAHCPNNPLLANFSPISFTGYLLKIRLLYFTRFSRYEFLMERRLSGEDHP